MKLTLIMRLVVNLTRFSLTNMKLIPRNIRLTIQCYPSKHMHTPYPACCNDMGSGYFLFIITERVPGDPISGPFFVQCESQRKSCFTNVETDEKGGVNPDKFEFFLFISFISSVIMHSGPSGGRPGGKLGASVRDIHIQQQSPEV